MTEILAGMDVDKVYPNKGILAIGERLLDLPPGALADEIFARLNRAQHKNPPLPQYVKGEDGQYRRTAA